MGTKRNFGTKGGAVWGHPRQAPRKPAPLLLLLPHPHREESCRAPRRAQTLCCWHRARRRTLCLAAGCCQRGEGGPGRAPGQEPSPGTPQPRRKPSCSPPPAPSSSSVPAAWPHPAPRGAVRGWRAPLCWACGCGLADKVPKMKVLGGGAASCHLFPSRDGSVPARRALGCGRALPARSLVP